MKIRAVVLSCLVGMVVLSVCYERSSGQSEVAAFGPKIGVVSIRKIFMRSARITKYKQQALAEQQGLRARWDQLGQKIKAQERGLNTLEPGSSDYLAEVKEIFQRQAALQAEQEYYKEQIKLKEQKMTEKLYGDVLQETEKLARQKGLDLVFETSAPDLPASNLTQLEFAMGTHKLLYCGNCSDITDEVLARVDANESERQKTEGAKP